MNKLLLALTLSLASLTLFGNNIEVTVEFKNFTKLELHSGEFIIHELDEKIKIANAKPFKIALPKTGTYRFSFSSDDFKSYIIYPSKITKQQNTITICLFNKEAQNNLDFFSFPFSLNPNMSQEQIQQRIESRSVNFIMHGIDSSIPEEYVRFKEKYGIGLVKQNCVIDPMSYKKMIDNNKIIYNYLNKKYGAQWLNELNIIPMGIK